MAAHRRFRAQPSRGEGRAHRPERCAGLRSQADPPVKGVKKPLFAVFHDVPACRRRCLRSPVFPAASPRRWHCCCSRWKRGSSRVAQAGIAPSCLRRSARRETSHFHQVPARVCAGKIPTVALPAQISPESSFHAGPRGRIQPDIRKLRFKEREAPPAPCEAP